MMEVEISNEAIQMLLQVQAGGNESAIIMLLNQYGLIQSENQFNANQH